MNIEAQDNEFVLDLVKHFVSVIRNYEEAQGRVIAFKVESDLAEDRKLIVELGDMNE